MRVFLLSQKGGISIDTVKELVPNLSEDFYSRTMKMADSCRTLLYRVKEQTCAQEVTDFLNHCQTYDRVSKEVNVYTPISKNVVRLGGTSSIFYAQAKYWDTMVSLMQQLNTIVPDYWNILPSEAGIELDKWVDYKVGILAYVKGAELRNIFSIKSLANIDVLQGVSNYALITADVDVYDLATAYINEGKRLFDMSINHSYDNTVGGVMEAIIRDCSYSIES